MILELNIWGNSANFILKYYRIDDLIFIEGYLAGESSFICIQNKKELLLKIVKLTVRKMYPIVLIE